MTFLANRLAQYAILAAIVLGVLWFALSAYTSGKNAKTEARLGRNQHEASTASGRDAVETTASVAARDREADQTTMENDRAIRDAEGADAPVTDAVRNAGLRSLCGRRSYSNDPRCVQFAPAK